MINIVTVQSGWILSKIAERIALNNRTHVPMKVSYEPRDDVLANFYIDVQNCFNNKSKTKDIGFFTHIHANDLRHVYSRWLALDHIVHMTQRYLNIFKEFYPENKMSVLVPAEVPPNFTFRPIKIGIFQRGEFEGKGFHFMQSLGDYPNLNRFKFLFAGKGWNKIMDLYNSKGVCVEIHDDSDYNVYNGLYDQIDYLLIPSLWEAGPMCLHEAHIKGVPIISSNVGQVNMEFPVEISFEAGNVRQLTDIFDGMVNYQNSKRDLVSIYSYEKYAEKLVEIVRAT